MREGIYFVNFKSVVSGFGGGLLVYDGGRFHGGDANYLYWGTCTPQDGGFSGVLRVAHFRGPRNSVFGTLRSCTLELSGHADELGFEAIGRVAERPELSITLKGQYQTALVDNQAETVRSRSSA